QSSEHNENGTRMSGTVGFAGRLCPREGPWIDSRTGASSCRRRGDEPSSRSSSMHHHGDRGREGVGCGKAGKKTRRVRQGGEPQLVIGTAEEHAGGSRMEARSRGDGNRPDGPVPAEKRQLLPAP